MLALSKASHILGGRYLKLYLESYGAAWIINLVKRLAGGRRLIICSLFNHS